MMDEQTEQLETVEQLARRLQVKDSWVYSKAANHEIPRVKIGKYIRFRRADVDEWLQRSSR